MALTSTSLFAAPDLDVRHVQCRCDHHKAGEIEQSDRDSVVFVLDGYFAKHLGPRHKVLAGSATALFFAAGRPHRVSHPGPPGDDCLVLQFSSTAMRSALIEIAGIDHLADQRMHSHTVLPAGLVAAREMFARRLQAGRADKLEVTETALALLSGTVRLGMRAQRNDRPRPQTRARRTEQVHTAQALLLASPDTSLSLEQVAVHVGASPFHLARIFRQQVGMPLHEFHLQNRLARAITDLLESDRDIAGIGLDYGFASHSHFSHAFVRRTGKSPSTVRELARNGSRQELSKIITALTQHSA